MTPDVSVLLPVWNARATLTRALESLQAQTFDRFEVIAVDDGSEDGSLHVLNEVARRDPRLRVIPQPHEGLVAALERGRLLCRAPLIARMDADDIAYPERLARQVERMNDEPSLGVLGCCVAFGGSSAGYARHVEWTNRLITHEQMALGRFRESPLAHPSVMFRRACAERHGGYRGGEFPEDYELWLRWFEAGVRFGKVPETLLQWNDPPARLSRSDPRYDTDAFYRVKAPYLARWLARNNPRHPKITVIGAGRITRRRVDALRAEGIDVEAWADLDPRKIGQRYDGRPVIAHADIAAEAFVVSYVASIGAAESIAAMLESRGFRRGTQFIEAA